MTVLERFFSLSMAFLFVVNCFQYLHTTELKWQLNRANEQIADLSDKITAQNNSIRQLRNISDIQTKNLILAEIKATAARRKADSQVMNFLTQPVSSSCQDAITWGSQQGLLLSKAWDQS